MFTRSTLRSVLAVASLACATSAMAADLPLRSAPPPFVPPPVFTWTGFYVGANAGYVFDSVDRVHATLVGPAAAGIPAIPTIPNRADGFIGGGQAGYNYQFAGSNFVIGMEIDAAYTDLSHREQFGIPAIPGIAPAGSLVNYRTSLDYLGTIRGRVGYAFNQFLVYGTGGFAYGGVTKNAVLTGPAGATIGTLNTSNTETGYAVGGGVEYALPTSSFLNFFHSSAVTIKAEYLHYDLGNTTISGSLGNINGNARTDVSGDLARAGINYKF